MLNMFLRMFGLFRKRMAKGGWKHDMAFPAPECGK
jgi:hypothetical protein